MKDSEVEMRGRNGRKRGLHLQHALQLKMLRFACRPLARQDWGPQQALLVFLCAGFGAGTNVVGLCMGTRKKTEDSAR